MSVELQWGVKIPLRDGIRLQATIYRPGYALTPSACIVTLTPYVSDLFHHYGKDFAARGFTFVIVDVRGRGNSEGSFQPLLQEAQDGYDVIEWLATQPYCDGRVAMWGGSYSGYAQWVTAKEFPPHLVTIVPAAAPYIGADFPMRSNIFCSFIVQWLTYTSGHTAQTQIFSDSAFWSESYRRWYDAGKAFCELDEWVGNPSDVFQEWISHPEPDGYWDRYNPTAAEYARLQLPVLTITGSYDDDQVGALRHYREHLRVASSEAQERHYLIIGPWDHAGTRAPSRELGGVTFGPDRLLDLRKLHCEWYAWTLQNGPKPEFLRKRVAYYVMGRECWRHADTLEEVSSHYETAFLDSAGGANDLSSSGSLNTTFGVGPSDTYTHDPRETRGPELDALSHADPASLVDQSLLHALRGRTLVYQTPPFVEDREITGFFKLSAWISIDCPDTDLFVSIHEIDASGASIRLSADAIRARYRDGLRTPKLVPSEAPLRYDFTGFTFVSRSVKRGHRLLLVIAPLAAV